MRAPRPALPLLLLAALLSAGCAVYPEPEVRALAGPTEGYTPTSAFLKLHVRAEDGSLVLLDFDRREWFTSEIAKRVDDKRLQHVSAQAMPRQIMNEYLVQRVAAPEDLESLRYDAMGASHEQRARMDAEHDRLLRAWTQRAPVPPAPLPSSPLPAR